MVPLIIPLAQCSHVPFPRPFFQTLLVRTKLKISDKLLHIVHSTCPPGTICYLSKEYLYVTREQQVMAKFQPSEERMRIVRELKGPFSSPEGRYLLYQCTRLDLLWSIKMSYHIWIQYKKLENCACLWIQQYHFYELSMEIIKNFYFSLCPRLKPKYPTKRNFIIKWSVIKNHNKKNIYWHGKMFPPSHDCMLWICKNIWWYEYRNVRENTHAHK